MKTNIYYLLFLSFLVSAIFSIQVAKQPFAVTPRSNLALSISADGWLKSGDALNFRGIGARSQAKISFDSWRPEGAGNALVRVSSCNHEVGRFVVSNTKAITIPIDQSCGQAQITFLIENPISSGDRELGVKLVSGEVTSRFGFALPEFQLAFGIWLISLITIISLGRILTFGALTSFTCIAALVSYQSLTWETLTYFTAWALIITFFSFGLRLCPRGEEVFPDHVPDNAHLRNWQLPSLFFITALALALRLWGIDFDTPATYHHDERWKVLAVLGMFQRASLNPEYFLHPSLLLYLSSGTAWLAHHLLAWPLDDMHVRLAGRVVSAVFGTLSVPFVFFTLREFGKASAGIAAAFLLCINPLHLTCSRYLKEDVLLVFMLLASAYFLSRFIRRNTTRDLVVHALFVGFAFGSKYTAIIMLLPTTLVLLGQALSNPRGSLKNILTVTSLTLTGFLITTPYALLDFSNFLKGITYESKHMLIGDSIAISPWQTWWMYHFTRSLIPALTQPLLWCGLAGIGVILKQAHQMRWMAVTTLIFYLAAEAVSAKVEPQVERYILPCIPFLLMSAAIFLMELLRSGWFGKISALLVMCIVALRTILLLQNIEPDTRTLLAGTVLRELPANTPIMADHPFNTPLFPPNTLQVSYPNTRPLINAYIKELTPENLRKRQIQYLLVSDMSFACLRFCPGAPLAATRSVERLAKDFEIVDWIENRPGAYGFHNPSLFLLRLKDTPVSNQLYLAQRQFLFDRAHKLFSKSYQVW